MVVPDLLHDQPVLAGPNVPTERRLRECLTFGFARGVEEERLSSCSRPALASSTFSVASFERDLFLDDLIDKGFPLVVRGRALTGSIAWFRTVLTQPPPRLEDVDLRRAVFRELDRDPERRRWVETAYLALVEFRDALCGGDHFNQRSLGVRRRIDVLLAFRKSVQQLERATMTSNSALRRVADWVEGVRKKEKFQRLDELLQFEDGRFVLETRLQAGYDGTLRRFEIVRVSEASHQAFPRGSLARFWRALWSLIKGYRFSEDDVMSQVLDSVFVGVEAEVVTALALLHQLEFYLRGANFADRVGELGLASCDPEWVSEDEPVQFEGLFNPWLMTTAGVPSVVPCDLCLDAVERTVIVTGPNSGGKTRLLQSLGVAQLLAQTGLPVVARRARMRWVDQMFLSLIERIEAEQGEGRLGLELMRIRSVFESTSSSALILMDELCSGTNPSEGEGIFEMVLSLFDELGPQVWITTHFLDFAARIRDRAEHDSCRSRAFFRVELSSDDVPTYQFRRGVADTSLARNTASRLGVTRDELRALIQGRQRSPGAP